MNSRQSGLIAGHGIQQVNDIYFIDTPYSESGKLVNTCSYI